MIALKFSNNRLLLDQEAEKPQSKTGEVLVRVRLAGICRTDLELTKGYMGYEGILGHEFAGEIDSSTTEWEKGTRVVGEINAGCGKCELCLRGLERHCPNRSVLGIQNKQGCMAEWLSLPSKNIYSVPEKIPDEVAVFTEPLAAALEIVEQVHIEPSHRICILGDGKLGLLISMALGQHHENETVLIGHHPEKMNLVKEYAKSMLENNISTGMYKQWDIVVEATGTTQGLKQAMPLVKPRGTIVLKSTMAHAESLDLTPLVIDEVTVVGSRCGRFSPALRLLAADVLPVKQLIEDIYPLSQAEEAWKRASTPGAKKVLLRIKDR